LARESRDGKNGDRPSQNNESRNLNGFVAAVNALERQLEHERSRAGAAEERVRELTEVIASLREAKAAAEAKAGMLESELERLRAPGAPIRLPDLWARLFSRWRHQQAASKSDA
jgi:chromosome segregation ATPase